MAPSKKTVRSVKSEEKLKTDKKHRHSKSDGSDPSSTAVGSANPQGRAEGWHQMGNDFAQQADTHSQRLQELQAAQAKDEKKWMSAKGSKKTEIKARIDRRNAEMVELETEMYNQGYTAQDVYRQSDRNMALAVGRSRLPNELTDQIHNNI